MIAQQPPLTSPLPALLVALDRRGITLSLAADGTPRAKAPSGTSLDAETRELLAEHREALLAHLMEARLWELGRASQAGDVEATAAFHVVLAQYETVCTEVMS